ncbi:MAG: SRPBCC domain-containing protein [Phycisphaeraceae bacterium]|nr:SRPBCC domain-containing protein [Phycisphaeraceae bacterium]MCB9847735.1 SRPBCC domain-containing protein [Phycisphaeraceae bacterium]
MNRTRWTKAAVGLVGLLLASGAGAEPLPPLIVETTIQAPIQDVWDAFHVESERTWMTPSNSVDLRIGGLIKCSYEPNADLDGDHAIQHEILALEPGRRIVERLVKGPVDFPHTPAVLGSVGILELDPIGPEATRVRSVMMGIEDTPAGVAAYEFFKEGNPFTFDAAKAHLERPDQARRTERLLGMLGALVGGEWIHEGKAPDGRRFRVRNVVRYGPDGRSLVANGWLGFGDAGMYDHGPTMVWSDPDGVVRFSSVHEEGTIGSGTIRLLGDTETSESFEWDWNALQPDGGRQHFAITCVILDPDRYTAQFEMIGPGGNRVSFGEPIEYRRLDVAPERFRTLTSGEVIGAAHSASTTTERHGMDQDRRIEVTEVIPAGIDEVWRSWTTSEGMTAFIGAPSDIELRRGGKYEIYFDAEGEPGSRGSETCEVVSYIPGKMLSFTWNAPPRFPNVRILHTWVVVEFTLISDDQTQVTLSHCGWDENMARYPQHREEWEGTHAYFEAAWPRVIAALKAQYQKH